MMGISRIESWAAYPIAIPIKKMSLPLRVKMCDLGLRDFVQERRRRGCCRFIPAPLQSSWSEIKDPRLSAAAQKPPENAEATHSFIAADFFFQFNNV